MRQITKKDLIDIIPTKYANDIFECQINNPDKPKIINLIELSGDTIYVQPPWQDDYVDSVDADYLKKWVNAINRKIIKQSESGYRYLYIPFGTKHVHVKDNGNANEWKNIVVPIVQELIEKFTKAGYLVKQRGKYGEDLYVTWCNEVEPYFNWFVWGDFPPYANWVTIDFYLNVNWWVAEPQYDVDSGTWFSSNEELEKRPTKSIYQLFKMPRSLRKNYENGYYFNIPTPKPLSDYSEFKYKRPRGV